MPQISDLRGDVAPKLLLRFLVIGGVNEGWDETIAALRISRAAYFRAKRQLEQLGFLDQKGNVTLPIKVEPTPAPPPLTLVPDPDERPDYPGMLARGQVKPRQLMMQVDNMPWSGVPQELMTPRSPAQKRKREQVYALQAVAQVVLGAEIKERPLKQALTACDECAEDVYEIITDMKARVDKLGKPFESPGAYLLAVAEKQRAKRTQAQPARIAVGTVAPGPVDEGIVPDPEFRDPVAEAKLAKLRKMGLIKKEEE
jgi:hypothetical protein